MDMCAIWKSELLLIIIIILCYVNVIIKTMYMYKADSIQWQT